MLEFLSKNTDVANALTAMSGVLVTVLAFLISIVSLVVSIRALKGQQKHNILSVKPIPEVTVADYEDSLRVKLRNNGNGPLFIKEFSVVGAKGTEGSLIACMGHLPNNRPWTHFATDFKNRVVMPGDFIPLLELTAGENETNFSSSRDLCRAWLAELQCNLVYSDLYDSTFIKYQKDLSWFGRNI